MCQISCFDLATWNDVKRKNPTLQVLFCEVESLIFEVAGFRLEEIETNPEKATKLSALAQKVLELPSEIRPSGVDSSNILTLAWAYVAAHRMRERKGES